MATKPSRTQDEDGSSTDAIDLLEQDHEDVKDLFDQYDELVENEGSDADKQAIAQQICTMLTAHATVEEELFYPAARDALKGDEMFPKVRDSGLDLQVLGVAMASRKDELLAEAAASSSV
ncbi:hemerythrin domain-containing protein [Rhizobacter sp. OV335]|jgi:hemerythrin superfamily protein|uniref:hemerythrin domain-containing protein n=1 Tax=Rhizobacter sp. OV335 TaxID=1500264 RepID=UPI0009218453|nr:hemerythrin domain-containing protein [Rhizobacter sp. OV335]SHN30002.1 Hemerythrin HHE cation binding domain-containing protein [Rhizobacter sp. OV335]